MDEKELYRMQMEIEQLRERQRYLENQVQEVTTTMKMGKGMVFGIVFILGSAGLALGTGLKKLWNL